MDFCGDFPATAAYLLGDIDGDFDGDFEGVSLFV